jgi:murein hydrolase activator
MYLKLQNSKFLLTTAKLIGFNIIFFCTVFPIFSQSKNQLEEQKKEIHKEIQDARTRLNQTKDKQESTLEKIDEIESQIERRESLLQNIDNQLSVIENNMSNTDSLIAASTRDLNKLKQEYSKMLVKAYRFKKSNSSWIFILAADNMMQCFRRWQYVKQYNRFRIKQYNLILEAENRLKNKHNVLASNKKNKEELLSDVSEQKTEMVKEKSENDLLVLKLTNDEKKLRNLLKEKQRQREQIGLEIEKIIAAEIAARRKKKEKTRKIDTVVSSSNNSKKNPDSKPKTTEPKEIETEIEVLSDVEIELSKNFSSNKGRFPSPVSGKIVSSSRKGATIQTDAGSKVKNIFEGTVKAVFQLSGNGYSVLVKHGVYFTLYTFMSDVYVKADDQISTGQTIGKLIIEKENNTSYLGFQLFNSAESVDPSRWIKVN